jgi:hypothetical protein
MVVPEMDYVVGKLAGHGIIVRCNYNCRAADIDGFEKFHDLKS